MICRPKHFHGEEKGNAAALWAPPARAGAPSLRLPPLPGGGLLRKLNPGQGSTEVARAADGPLCGLAVFREPRGWQGTPWSVASAGVRPLAPVPGCWAGRSRPLLALATSGQWSLPAPPRFQGLSRCPARPGAPGGGRGLQDRGHHAPPAQLGLTRRARRPLVRASERGRRGMKEMGKTISSQAGPGRGSAGRGEPELRMAPRLHPVTVPRAPAGSPRIEAGGGGETWGPGQGCRNQPHRPHPASQPRSASYDLKGAPTPGVAPRPLRKHRCDDPENERGDPRK